MLELQACATTPGSKVCLTGLRGSVDKLGFCVEALGETLGLSSPALAVCLHSMASGTALKTLLV